MRRCKRLLSTILVVCLTLLLNVNVYAEYQFVNPEHELPVKRDRLAIYDLVDLYYDIIGRDTSSSNFGIMNYSGVCSTVEVDGKTVPLEEYVAGVIKHEIGAEYDNPELLKAQAVAARSFLISSKQNSNNCSVGNSQSFQTYSDVDPNNERDKYFIDAANATAGQVVTRDGKVALTQYQSYPAGKWCTEDSSGWHVEFQRFSSDDSTKWTWNGPAKSTVRNANNYPGTEMNYNNGHHYGMSQTIAGYLAKKENYSYTDLIKLFYGESITQLSDGEYTGNIEYVNGEFGQVTYWNQGDYGSYYYSSDVSKPQYTRSKGGYATIASHGCGPTSLAIVLSSFTGQVITPIQTTQKVCAMGGCTNSGSYYWPLESIAKEYGYKTEFVKKTGDVSKVTTALGRGDSLVIALMGPGIFTSGGHYIVLTGTRSDGYVSVADPASRERTNTKWFKFNTVVEQAQDSGFLIITK